MKNVFSKVLSLIVCVSMLLGAMPLGILAAIDVSADPYNHVISEKEYAISPGVTESAITLNDATGKNQNKIYVFNVDQDDSIVDLKASYRNQDSSSWGTAVMSEQAAFVAAQGYNVVGAINVNLRFESDEPMGMLVIDGEVQHEEEFYYPYFVMNKDGTYELREGSEPLTGNEWQAVTTTAWLVKDGKNLYSEDHSQGNRAPRTCIGLKADGSLVLMVNDGRNIPTSVGFTMYEMAQTMIDLGCVRVANCDGGGTSTFLSKREGSDSLELRNVPSDGSERATLTGLLIISKVSSTGEFDHATVSPAEEYYTPGTEIPLTALGVDYSGAAADTIPETVTWALAEGYEDMGSFATDATVAGNEAKTTFVSNGTEGEVVIELRNGDTVVGSTTLYIYHPDELFFNSDSLNLKYEESSNLGLVAKYMGNTLNLKAEDIEYTIQKKNADDVDAGSFDGLTFTVTDNYLASVTVTATATYKADPTITASITINVGMQPSIVLDGGDTDGLSYDTFGRGTGINGSFAWQPSILDGVTYTEETCDIISYHYMNSIDSSRGGKESLELITSDMVEWTDIIRFGNGALKLNYDFTETNGIEGACIGFAEDIILTGSPTAVGCWVYAPEGTGNYWLRMAIKVGDDPATAAYTYVNFTERCDTAYNASNGADYGGINWTGWKYVEADLSQYAGQQINIIRGETIRVMDCYGSYGVDGNGQGSFTKDGTFIPRTERKGWILVDNLQFVYGANNQDVTEPTISKITTIDSTGLEYELNGAILDANQPNIRFYYDDNELTDRYATGVVTKLFYVDGVLYNGGQDFSNEGFIQMTKLELANGKHSLTAYVKDGNGNVTRKTVYFEIKGTEEYPSVSVDYDKDAALYLGDTFTLNINTDIAASQIKEVYGKLNITKTFGIKEIIPAAGYAMDRQSYANGVLTFAVKPTGEATTGSTVATVVVSVPTTLSEGSSFEWRMEEGWISISESEDSWSFSTATAKHAVNSKYSIDHDVLIVGLEGKLTVLDESGAPAAGVGIYNAADDALIGTTNSRGILTTDYFTEATGKWTVYAKDTDGAVSFPTAVASYPAVGEQTPYYIIVNAAEDPSHGKNISWMTNPDYAAEAAVIRVSKSADMSDSIAYAGSTTRVFYDTTVAANYSNCVELSALEAGTTYYYQVGDGIIWSETRSFTTAPEVTKETNFFIFGDMQGTDALMLETFSDLMTAGGTKYDFGAQVGDAIDNVNSYEEWQTLLGVFTKDMYAYTDIVHTIGNHETFGDANADKARPIFNLPTETSGGYYSYEYGSVYVAVIGYTLDTSIMEASLEWLLEDASASKCPWKILVMHVPTYYSNSEQTDSLYYTEHLPAVASAAGITAVFSGHDHSYGRTSPVDGTTYYIAGTVGDKKYTCAPNGFPFVSTSETGLATPTQNYNSIYITGYATAETLRICTYDVAADGTQTLIDVLELKREITCEHTYELDAATGVLSCTQCAHEVAFADYSGLYTDDGGIYYSIAGNRYSGWMEIDGKHYYFAPNTYAAVDGEYTTPNGVTYIFADGYVTKGVWVETEKGMRYWYGSTYYKRVSSTSVGGYMIDGNFYLFDSQGYMRTGICAVLTTNAPVYYDCGTDGIATLYSGVHGEYFYLNGTQVKGNQVLVYEGNYYCISVYNKLIQGKSAYLSDKFVTGVTLPDGSPLKIGRYYFEEDGRMILTTNGPEDDYLYIGGERQTGPAAITFNGYLYCLGEDNKLIRGTTATLSAEFVEGKTFPDGSPLRADTYEFDETGRMILKSGPDGDYMYKNNLQVTGLQLVEYNGGYYCVSVYNKLIRGKTAYLSETFVKGTPFTVGYYEFDETGKLILKDGPVGDYFYKDGVKVTGLQLIEYEGSYYCVSVYNKLVRGKTVYLSETFVKGTPFTVGYYEFDEDGKMVMKDGPDGDYFYKDGIRVTGLQVVIHEGDYYCISVYNKLVRGKTAYLSERFVSGVTLPDGSPMPVGYYEFDENGKIIF